MYSTFEVMSLSIAAFVYLIATAAMLLGSLPNRWTTPGQRGTLICGSLALVGFGYLVAHAETGWSYMVAACGIVATASMVRRLLGIDAAGSIAVR